MTFRPLPDGKLPDIGFIDQMGWLMVWGTTLLFIDAILIILLYEKLGRYLRKAPFTRILICVACVLTFDQAGFFTALHFVAGAPIAVFFGGWFAKMGAALAYSAMLVAYLRWFETRRSPAPRGLSDVFDTLTYRERYEALVEHVGRDGLTGLLHRGRFDSDGEKSLRQPAHGQPLSLLIVDVDHFKSINDRFGHAEGDRVLRSIAQVLTQAAGARGSGFQDRRRGIRHPLLASACGRQIARRKHPPGGQGVRKPLRHHVSAGIATVNETGRLRLPISSPLPTNASTRPSPPGATASSAKRGTMPKTSARGHRPRVASADNAVSFVCAAATRRSQLKRPSARSPAISAW